MATHDIINLTPHEITIVGEGSITFPPSGQVARCKETREEMLELGVSSRGATKKRLMGNHFDLPVSAVQYGPVEIIDADGNTSPGIKKLPGKVYIVSFLVAQQLWADKDDKRMDIFCPGPLVRDDGGRPIGCKGLTCHKDRWFKEEVMVKGAAEYRKHAGGGFQPGHPNSSASRSSGGAYDD